jgi:DNA-binding HxlR family transcriptional regulator
MDEKSCIQKTLKIIGSKWTVMILRELCEGTKRFGELSNNLPHISSKTLSLRLKELEHNAIVTRTVYQTVPLKVEYTLTEKGKSLKSIINSMHIWGESYS